MDEGGVESSWQWCFIRHSKWNDGGGGGTFVVIRGSVSLAKCCWSGNEALCDVILTAQLIIIANIRLDDEVCKFCWTEQVPVTSF